MKTLGMAVLAGIMLLAGCGSVKDKPAEETSVQDKKGTYIPENLEDCFVQLKKLLKPEDIEKMKTNPTGVTSRHSTLCLTRPTARV